MEDIAQLVTISCTPFYMMHYGKQWLHYIGSIKLHETKRKTHYIVDFIVISEWFQTQPMTLSASVYPDVFLLSCCGAVFSFSLASRAFLYSDIVLFRSFCTSCFSPPLSFSLFSASVFSAALLPPPPLSLSLSPSLSLGPGVLRFLTLVNRCLALQRQHVIGCLTRLTLAVHILPHGTIKGKTDFRLRPKFIDWNNCIPKTLRHFSPWRFSNPQW